MINRFKTARKAWVAGLLALALVGCATPATVGQSSGEVDPQFAVALNTEDGVAAPLSGEELSDLTESDVLAIIEESSAEVDAVQDEYESEASAADYAKAVAAYDAFMAEALTTLDEQGVDGFLEDLGALESTVESDQLTTVAFAKTCLTVYKWQLQTIAWIGIGLGALTSIAGLFAAGTVIGLPAGAVAGAVGIALGVTSTYFLWKVDQQKWDSKRVCF